MKSQGNGFCFQAIPGLLIAILLFLSVFVVRLYLNRQNNPQHISREFQKEIESIESRTKRRVDILNVEFGTNLKTGFQPDGEFVENSDKEEDIFLFVFKEDSLIYWNNNKVIFPANFFKVHTGAYFACLLKNGWYGFHCIQKGAYRFLGCYLIKNEFPFQNEFIKNRFAKWFPFHESLSITEETGKYPIYSADRTCLFCLNFDKYRPGKEELVWLIFLLFIIGALLVFYFIFRLYAEVAWFNKRENLFVICYCATICCLRVFQNYLGFPAEIYRSELFSPAWYSSSAFLPSLGDFTLNAMMLLMISLAFYHRARIVPGLSAIRQKQQFGWTIVFLFLLLCSFQGIGYFISDLVINSSLSLKLQNISGLTYESGYGLFIITVLLFSLWMASEKMFEFVFRPPKQAGLLVFSGIIAICIYYLFCLLSGWNMNFTITFLFLIYITSHWYFKENQIGVFSVQKMLFLLCFYSIFATILLNKSNEIKETEKLNLLAGKLVTQRNPVTEVLYEQVERRLYADSMLNQWINSVSVGNNIGQDSLGNYLKTRYFKDYWKKYQIQVTFCDPMKELRIQPQGYLVNCNTYFRGIINSYGKATMLPNLYFLDYGFGKEYYLAIFSKKAFEGNTESQPALFIEFNLKNAYPDPGYPGLLMDKTRIELPNLSDYSYGLYQNGRLIRSVGANSYKMELGQYKTFSSKKAFFTEELIVHFQYPVNDTDALLISKKKDDFLSFATPFSYVFILFAVVALFVTWVINFPKNFNSVPASLRNRLYFSLIGILVVTMLATGIGQAINIVQINSKKNVDNLRERAYSVVVEVQHKYGPLMNMHEIAKGDIEDFLIKLSNVFFTDINVYSDKGLLLSSSRPQIFEEGLLSERMDPGAYQKLVVEKSSVFIHHESIGNMQFNSAYLPFYNEHDRLLGFVNLPSFAKQDESKKEISSFLVTFLNVYILLILFGIFITVLISNYITAPLAMLAGKIAQLRLGMNNEKITWKQNDEIGQLVFQYNRMIDELGNSAEMLAKSERESAWREMARQVAHEIKNPLTPMKLSAQYLEKAWNEKAPDWDQRLARFTKTLVEQIDALSVIASDFSDFAKIQTVVFSQIDVEEVVRFALSMYQDSNRICYVCLSDVSEPHIYGDRSQLIRLFTNLLNNATQAIGEHREGIIRIQITKEQQQIVVKVSDNGCGISSDRTERIFQPDFTTKTSGMGLGLAIVKGIVEGMKGEISFTSEEQKGTIFIIKFPANDENPKSETT